MLKDFLLISFVLMLIASVRVNAQDQLKIGAFAEGEWMSNWVKFEPQKNDYPSHTKVIKGNIKSNTTFTSSEVYLLEGSVYVEAGATLTIEPGTIILGSFQTKGSLVIGKGAKILAKGTKVNPIVFTSQKAKGERKSGDWGGVVILGASELNTVSGIAVANGLTSETGTYGGDIPDDSSGELSYVRIEYAGINRDNYAFNGFTLCGVGSGTVLNNIQVSHSQDDGIEFFGGSASMSNVVLIRNLDDDLDFTQGYTGKIKNVLVIRDPLTTDHTVSKAVEIDGYVDESKFDVNKKYTSVELENVTFVTMTSRLPLPKFEAISIKKNATVTLKNAIIDNFKNLINIQNRGQEASDKFIVENVCAHVSDNLIEYHTAGKVKDLLNEVYSKKLNVVNEQIVNDFSSPKNFDFGYDESLKIENVSKN